MMTSCSGNRVRPVAQLLWLALVALAGADASAQAGYEQPCFIDGCQSVDGRFVITAEPVGKITNHGPNQWTFVWKDTKTNETRRFPARGVSGGQVYGQLYLAPDGETFALFNHLTLWYPGKSDMHGATKLWGERAGSPKDIKHEAFSRRLILYRKDGSILKELGISDLLQPAELAAVTTVFTRVQWLENYPGLNYRTALRPAYALCQVSPDYTVLELHAVVPRGSKDKAGRLIRVSLTDGRLLPGDAPLGKQQTPVRAFLGPAELPDHSTKTRESFVPSLDPVRIAGTLTGAGPLPPVVLKLVKSGFKKLDTPSWLPAEKCVLFTDLETNKLYRCDAATKAIAEIRGEAVRGRAAPDGSFHGVFGGKLATWKPGMEPVVLDSTTTSGSVALNDLAISARGMLYYTTLKDPERGRLTRVDLKTKAATVVFDGNDHPEWSNPNGLAVAADGKALFVAVSSYKERTQAGLYRFPIRDDGSLDLAAGQKRWAAVVAPDGVAIGPEGFVYCTDGGTIRVFNGTGTEVSQIRVPHDTATNLTFGGPNGRTLFVTTHLLLYAGEWQAMTK